MTSAGPDVETSPFSSFPERYAMGPIAATAPAEAWRQALADLADRIRGPARPALPERDGRAAGGRRTVTRDSADGSRAARGVAPDAMEPQGMERRIETLRQALGRCVDALGGIGRGSPDEASRRIAGFALGAAARSCGRDPEAPSDRPHA